MPKSFTINCHPASLWKVRVVVHNSRQEMRNQRMKEGGVKHTNCEAFCIQFSDEARFKKQLIAEMHFYFSKGSVNDGDIIHECSHAAVAYAAHCGTNLGHYLGDEHFAESMEHLVEGTRNGIKMDFRKKPKREHTNQ